MTPARALDEVLKGFEPRATRRTDAPAMRWAMIGVAIFGLNASFIGVTHHLAAQMNRDARVRAALAAEGLAARFETMLADSDARAGDAAPLAARLLESDVVDERTNALQTLERLFQGAPVAGGTVVNTRGDMIASFGRAGPDAGEARTRLPALRDDGIVEMPPQTGLVFFRVAGRAPDDFLILHRSLSEESERDARLLLAIPFATLRAAAARLSPGAISPDKWQGALFLYDGKGRAIAFLAGDETLVTDAAIPDARSQGGTVEAARLVSGTINKSLHIYRAQFPERGLSVVAFEPRMTALSVARRATAVIELSVYAALAGLLFLAWLVRNEWRRHDETLKEFTAFARMSQTALALAGVNVIHWRPREQQARFSAGWADMLDLNREDISNGFDALTRRLHPEDREAAGDGYQRLARGEIGRLSRVLRLRRADDARDGGSYVAVKEDARAVSDRALDGVREVVIVHRPLNESGEP